MENNKVDIIDPVTNIVQVIPEKPTDSDNIVDDQTDLSENTDDGSLVQMRLTREMQGMFAYQNWLTTHEDDARYMSGQQKRAVRREFMRKAKKGVYEHIFNATGKINSLHTNVTDKTESAEDVR